LTSGNPDDTRLRPVKRPFGGPRLGMFGCFLASAAFIGACYYLKRQHADTLVLIGVAATYGFVILALGSYVSTMVQRASKISLTAAGKRYRMRFNVAMAVYVVALIGSLSAVIQYNLTGPVAYALAILPALPLLAVIAIMGIYLREETDEFERSVRAEAALWASGGLLAIATVWGFLELFGLVPHVQTWWAFPIWAFLLAPGNVLARRRYR
jgi:hypothetical protein